MRWGLCCIIYLRKRGGGGISLFYSLDAPFSRHGSLKLVNVLLVWFFTSEPAVQGRYIGPIT